MSFDTSTLHANVYLDFQDTELLFQFILNELLSAQDLVSQIQQLVKELSDPSPDDHREFLTMLNEHILALSSSDRVFPWETNRGALRKLCDFCRIFTLECRHCEPSNQLHQLAQQAVYQGLATHLWFMDHTTFGKDPDVATVQTLTKHVNSLAHRLKKMAKLLPNFLPKFEASENVLYFLHKHRPEFHRLFGVSVRQLFPWSSDELWEFLQQRYTLRGFDHLIPCQGTAS